MDDFKYKKYKLYLNKLDFLKSELKLKKDILISVEPKLIASIYKFCNDNNIKIDHEKQVKSALNEDDQNLNTSSYKKNKDISEIYKDIAKKAHPDKHVNNKDKYLEMEELFKEASSALSNGNWNSILKIAEKLNIKLRSISKIIDIMSEEILEVEKEIKSFDTRIGWLYYKCDESEECKESIVKLYLNTKYDLKL